MSRPILLATALLTAIVASPAVAGPLYNIKDITPTGYSTAIAFDVNSSGNAVGVAGRFVGGSLEEAFFFYDHATGTSTAFAEGVLTPRSSIIGNAGYREAAINDSDFVAGTARFTGGAPESRGFIYNGTSITNLGVMPGAFASGIRPASDALDINSSGVATGTASSGASIDSDNLDIYTGTASPVTDIDGDITPLTKDDFGRAINDAGQVAGRNELGKATLFTGAAETIVVAGTAIADDSSEAMDLNDSGQLAVQNLTTQRAYRYDSDTTTLLPIPSLAPAMGGHRTNAKAINERGDVVGWGDRDSGVSGQGRGFVYDDSDAATYILEDHVILTGSDVEGLSDWGDLATAWGINDHGWIVGQGDRRFDGATFPTSRAYLLIPFDGLAGDYNEDGSVDAADYTSWRDAVGSAAGTLPNDVDGGVIGSDQYNTWRDNFGATSALGASFSLSPSAAATAAPEPATLALMLLGTSSGLACRWRRRATARTAS